MFEQFKRKKKQKTKYRSWRRTAIIWDVNKSTNHGIAEQVQSLCKSDEREIAVETSVQPIMEKEASFRLHSMSKETCMLYTATPSQIYYRALIWCLGSLRQKQQRIIFHEDKIWQWREWVSPSSVSQDSQTCTFIATEQNKSPLCLFQGCIEIRTNKIKCSYQVLTHPKCSYKSKRKIFHCLCFKQRLNQKIQNMAFMTVA